MQAAFKQFSIFGRVYAVFKELSELAEFQSNAIAEESEELLDAGHSKVCAGAHALDSQGLLDGDLRNVIVMGGGCQKCGI